MVNIPINDFKILIEEGESFLSSQRYSPITVSSYIRIWQQAVNYAASVDVKYLFARISAF